MDNSVKFLEKFFENLKKDDFELYPNFIVLYDKCSKIKNSCLFNNYIETLLENKKLNNDQKKEEKIKISTELKKLIIDKSQNKQGKIKINKNYAIGILNDYINNYQRDDETKIVDIHRYMASYQDTKAKCETFVKNIGVSKILEKVYLISGESMEDVKKETTTIRNKELNLNEEILLSRYQNNTYDPNINYINMNALHKLAQYKKNQAVLISSIATDNFSSDNLSRISKGDLDLNIMTTYSLNFDIFKDIFLTADENLIIVIPHILLLKERVDNSYHTLGAINSKDISVIKYKMTRKSNEKQLIHAINTSLFFGWNIIILDSSCMLGISDDRFRNILNLYEAKFREIVVVIQSTK